MGSFEYVTSGWRTLMSQRGREKEGGGGVRGGKKGAFKMLYICFSFFFPKKEKKNQLSLQEPKDYKAKCGYRNQAPNNYHSIRYKWKHCATSSMTRMNMARKKEQVNLIIGR